MESPDTWDALAAGLMVLLLLFWFGPGTKRALKQGAQIKDKDWKGALIPIALVVLFVILLIKMT